MHLLARLPVSSHVRLLRCLLSRLPKQGRSRNREVGAVATTVWAAAEEQWERGTGSLVEALLEKKK